MAHHVCPSCGGPVEQVHRRPLDRLVNAVYPVHRYRCPSPDCRWEGLLHTRRRKPGRKGLPRWAWVLVIAVSVAAAVALVAYLETPTRPPEMESGAGPP